MFDLSSFRFAAILILLAAPALAQSPTATRLVTSPHPSKLGDPVTLTAEVDGLGGGAPTGAVTFTDGAIRLGSAALRAPGAGQATVAAGGAHSCALTENGGVECWGNNGGGQLGDGTKIDRSTPVAVAGLTSGVVAITSGAAHTCALTSVGGVKCWGANWAGQRGDGTTATQLTPGDVVGLSSGVIAIAAAGAHTCALTRDGRVKCWGFNHDGELGDGTMTTRLTPIDVVDLASGIVAVAAGGQHSCALTSVGGVKCWGSNHLGQLGDGTTVTRLTPVGVAGLSSGARAISAGYLHSCAVTGSGGAQCWGSNDNGQLGDGSGMDRWSPVDVVGLSSGIVAISAGGFFSCALTGVGGAKCWGANDYGQLGDGTTNNRSTPVAVYGFVTSGAAAIVTGFDHACAVARPGSMKCWGLNERGQLGVGKASRVLTPEPVAIEKAKFIASGSAHGCAVTDGGRVRCWGLNGSGQVGDGTTNTRYTPVAVMGLAGIRAVSAGGAHNCAVTDAGGVKCWGNNAGGQLGDGTTISRVAPVTVMGLSSGVVALATGFRHSCALTSSGGVKCWGDNYGGQLGDGTTGRRLTPVDVAGLSSGVVAIAAGYNHTCASTNAGRVKCWGYNNFGQIGDGTTIGRLTPVDVASLPSVFAIAAGSLHTCALIGGGGVRCWGANYGGQIGDGTTTDRLTPVVVRGLAGAALAISAGRGHSCALIGASGAKCWGGNGAGEIGDGTTINRVTPVAVLGLSGRPAAISAGGQQTCALIGAGEVECWGSNFVGQVGIGDTNKSIRPSLTQDFRGLVRARAQLSTGVLGVGVHTLVATYGGDAAHSGSSGPTSHQVDP